MARVGKTRNTSGLLRNETRLSNPSVVFGKANPAGTIGQMWCPLLNHLARESLWMQHWLCQPPEPPAERCPCCQCWASVESGGPCPQHMYRGVFFLVLCLLQTFGVSKFSKTTTTKKQQAACFCLSYQWCWQDIQCAAGTPGLAQCVGLPCSSCSR